MSGFYDQALGGWPHRTLDDPPPPVTKMVAGDLGLEGPVWVLKDEPYVLVEWNERGEITIDGFYYSVQPPSELERVALERMPLDLPAVMAGLGLLLLGWLPV